MSKSEKCCCNCSHCARWSTSKGVQCHCDLTDRYLGYIEVMDTDNNCCRWEKDTKWDEEEKHDKEIYNQALEDAEKRYREWAKSEYGKVVADDVLTLRVLRSLKLI